MDARQEDIQRLGTTAVAPMCGSTRAQRRIVAGLITCALVGLAPAAVWLAPASDWHARDLIAGLWALSACVSLSEIALKRAIPVQFVASPVLAVLLLLVGGPIPAFVGWLLPDLVDRVLLRRYRLLTAGLAANVASYGWCVLAGAGVLSLTHAGRMSPAMAPSVLAVGFTLEFVNWSIARGLYGTLYQGYRLVALVRDELLSVVVPELVMLAFASLCAVLIAPLGSFLLAIVAPTVLIPQLALPMLARSRSVASLDPVAATRLYIEAIATHMRVDRPTRRTALAAAVLLHEPGRVPIGVRPERVRDVQLAVWHVSERWDGRGRPAGLSGSLVPQESRLLAVAHTWSELTANGGPQLPQAQAMLALELQAASRLDPRMVQAAGEIISTEAAFAQLDSFQPKLHTLPLPRFVRERALPRALASYTPA